MALYRCCAVLPAGSDSGRRRCRKRRVPHAVPSTGLAVPAYNSGQDRNSQPGFWSHAAYPHRTTGEIGAGTVIGEDVSEDDSYPVGEPVFLVCGHCGDLSAPAAGARTVATVVRSLGKPLWRVDPGAGSGAYLRYERITFHELLQARDWPIVHGIPESLPDRTSSGLAGHDGKTDVGDQPGNRLLRSELFRHRIPPAGGDDAGCIPPKISSRSGRSASGSELSRRGPPGECHGSKWRQALSQRIIEFRESFVDFSIDGLRIG